MGGYSVDADRLEAAAVPVSEVGSLLRGLVPEIEGDMLGAATVCGDPSLASELRSAAELARTSVAAAANQVSTLVTELRAVAETYRAADRAVARGG